MSDKPGCVRDFMSPDVATLSWNDELSIATQIMDLGRIRHMPVLGEDGELVGVLSQRDLFRGALVEALGYGAEAQRKISATIRVKEVMTNNPLTTTPDTPLAEAARLMRTKMIGCLPVLEDGELVGILTEGDFVAHYASAS